MTKLTFHQQNRPPTRENFRVKTALTGLELGPGDRPLLQYIDFLSELIPVGSLHFVHIIPKVRLFSTPEEEHSFFEENYQRTDELYERIKEKIHGWSFSSRIPHLDFDIRIGNPLEELLAQAKGLRPDLVVIGQRADDTHHGILAKNFARKIRSNALVIPEKARQSLKHILVPIDFSRFSVKALDLALKMRTWIKHPIKISCLHVFELPSLPMDRSRSREEVEKLLERDRKEAFQVFLKKHFPEDADNLDCHIVGKNGIPVARHLFRFAEDHDIDMTIMGAVGHTKVELLLMGSVTEKYLALNQQIPTLLVKQ